MSNSLKKVLNIIWVGLLKIQIVIFTTAFVLMVIAIFVEVIFRYVIVGWRIYGAEELASLIAVWLYFIGAAYGTHEGSHLKADLIPFLFKSPRLQLIASALTSLISLGVAAYMLTWSYDWFVWGLTKGETAHIGGSIGSFPYVYSQASVFAGFNLMVFYFIIEVIKNIRKARLSYQVKKQTA